MQNKTHNKINRNLKLNKTRRKLEIEHVRYRLLPLPREDEAETLNLRADEVPKSGAAPSAALPDGPAFADPGKSVKGHRL